MADRHVRDAFFLFLWFAVAAALFFLFSIRKCVVILEWKQLKVYVLEIFFSTFMLSDRPMSEQEIQMFDPPDNFFWKSKSVEESSPKNIRKKFFYCLIWSIVCDNVSVRWESSARHLLFLWSMYSTIFFAISCRPGS